MPDMENRSGLCPLLSVEDEKPGTFHREVRAQPCIYGKCEWWNGFFCGHLMNPRPDQLSAYHGALEDDVIQVAPEASSGKTSQQPPDAQPSGSQLG